MYLHHKVYISQMDKPPFMFMNSNESREAYSYMDFQYKYAAIKESMRLQKMIKLLKASNIKRIKLNLRRFPMISFACLPNCFMLFGVHVDLGYW